MSFMAERPAEPGAWNGPAAAPRMQPSSGPGSLVDLLSRMAGAASTPLTREATIPIGLRRLHRGATLFHEGTPLRTLYCVRSGSLRCVRTQSDGSQQVSSFAQAGDLLGFESLHGGHPTASAMALEESGVFSLAVADLQDLHRRCPAVDIALHGALSRQLVRAAEITGLMAASAADVRLARFVLWYARRKAELGESPRRMRLRMCRRDIASVLGVANETVSRSFTALVAHGYLWVDNREVEILDLEGLQSRARGTGGLAERGAARGDREAHDAHDAPQPGLPLLRQRPASDVRTAS
jgi:CRP/FNR family transcriptional regulator